MAAFPNNDTEFNARTRVYSVQTTPTHSQALWYVNPGMSELRQEPLFPPKNGECQVRALYSAISRGTESLIFQGLVPESEYDRMRAPFMGGDFPFPVKYGYCHIGEVTAGPEDRIGQRVFSLSPHQDVINLPTTALVTVPPTVNVRRAVLAANMETALNAVWTGKPCAADRIAVIGGGLIGLLVAYLCAHLPGANVTVIDPLPARERICKQLGVRFATTADGIENCDVVFHTSASAQGLDTALSVSGNEATVVELSWYGSKSVPTRLGQAFHSQQLKLLSCQVGHIEASHRPRWDYQRRLAAAMSMLADERLDCMLESPIRFADLPDELTNILKPGADRLCQVIDYSHGA